MGVTEGQERQTIFEKKKMKFPKLHEIYTSTNPRSSLSYQGKKIPEADPHQIHYRQDVKVKGKNRILKAKMRKDSSHARHPHVN